jgi:hypothetical protein
MKTKEPHAMEEIHDIREKMYEETAGMSVHDKLLFIREKAAAFKSKYGLKTKPMHRKGAHVADHK